jgi:hypothetical protein
MLYRSRNIGDGAWVDNIQRQSLRVRRHLQYAHVDRAQRGNETLRELGRMGAAFQGASPLKKRVRSRAQCSEPARLAVKKRISRPLGSCAWSRGSMPMYLRLHYESWNFNHACCCSEGPQIPDDLEEQQPLHQVTATGPWSRTIERGTVVRVKPLPPRLLRHAGAACGAGRYLAHRIPLPAVKPLSGGCEEPD